MRDRESFICLARKRHGDKYDYSNSNYSFSNKNVEIKCPDHGVFLQTPATHIRSNLGCPHCSRENQSKIKCYTLSHFLEKARKRHGNHYDYSLVDYKGSAVKVKIICPKHGIFEQIPLSHYKGGCKFCRNEKNGICQRNTREGYVFSCKKIHGEKYDYSETEYTKLTDKVKIKCRKHGDFYQLAGNHQRGAGCPKCRNEGHHKRFQMGREKFMELASKYHSDSYNYSLVEYVNCNIKIKIICRKHNKVFEQTPSHHLRCNKLRACPSCSNNKSSQEDFISYLLEELGIRFKLRTKTIIPPYELDFYLPDYNLAIECNGLFWHSEFQGNYVGKTSNYHIDKSNKCASKNINLMHLLETDVQNRKRVVISAIKRYIKCGKYQIPNEKCEVKEISDDTKSKFLNKYELNKDSKSNLNLGLFYKGRLISVAALLRYKSGNIKLLRFSETFYFSVINGWQKLEEYIGRVYNPNKIQIKLNNNWPRNDINLSDFTVKRKTQHKPWYYSDSQIKTAKLHTERQFINKLKKQGKYNDNISVAENCVNNKWNRIWDTGKTIYTKQIQCTS